MARTDGSPGLERTAEPPSEQWAFFRPYRNQTEAALAEIIRDWLADLLRARA